MPYTDYNQVLQDIADNIREVTGSTASIRFVDMPDLISAFIGPHISLYGESSSTWKRKLIPYIGNTSGMTDMHNMLKDINQRNFPLDLSNFDTSNVTNMSHMLEHTYASSIDISSFDTSNVTDMSYMLHTCYCGEELDLSHFDTSKVTDMAYMFFELGYGSTASVALNVTGWDVSHVTDFSACFGSYQDQTYHNGITELDLSGWDTSSATNMISMFTYKLLRKIWVPSTFVATRCPAEYKPFRYTQFGPVNACHIYTDASSASAQGWGTISSPFVVHYNSTHTDYENA